MLKKILSVVFTVILCVGMMLPQSVFADKTTASKIENIINGEQDFLVLAVLGSKDTSNSFDVTVYDIIGSTDDTDEDSKEYVEKKFPNSITVHGIDSYMYIGSDVANRNPRKGDNVLLSIDRVREGSYTVENGVFLVDTIDRDEFNFEIPETYSNKPERYELSALWVYVYTNGEISDITIKNEGNIYKKDGKEVEIDMSDNRGIKFLDEFGDPIITNDSPYSELQNNPNSGNKPESKWKLVTVIVVFGLVSGLFFVKFTKKFDKRFE